MPMAFEILPGLDLNHVYISPRARVARLSLTETQAGPGDNAFDSRWFKIL
jgi:hypothetical protein